MCSYGNKGKNLDLMLSVRHEPKKNEITAEAELMLERFIESLDYKPVLEENKKYGMKNKKIEVNYDKIIG